MLGYGDGFFEVYDLDGFMDFNICIVLFIVGWFVVICVVYISVSFKICMILFLGNSVSLGLK